jgi:hypothetical protein
MDIADKFAKKHPQFNRDFGAKILNYIQATPEPEVALDLGFAAHSLFCEWAYVLDMDMGILEVYRGFNKSPLPSCERFKFLEEQVRPGRDGGLPEYYPLKLQASFTFEQCRSMSFKDWVTAIGSNQSED